LPKKRSVSGSVAVTFVIDTDGKISSFESIRSPDESFEREIRKTLMQWKFKPAKRRGVPVKQKTSVEIDFSYRG
jgi:TonB family protein